MESMLKSTHGLFVDDKTDSLGNSHGILQSLSFSHDCRELLW